MPPAPMSSGLSPGDNARLRKSTMKLRRNQRLLVVAVDPPHFVNREAQPYVAVRRCRKVRVGCDLDGGVTNLDGQQILRTQRLDHQHPYFHGVYGGCGEGLDV